MISLVNSACSRSLAGRIISAPLEVMLESNMKACPQCQSGNSDQAENCVVCDTPLPISYDDDNLATILPGQATAGVAPTPVVKPIGQFGSRYQIISKLGSGGMGTVYKVNDLDLDRIVALKVVRPELTVDPQVMERFKQELLLARKISHKNILRIHDLGDHNGMKFISMAYVEGHDLSGTLKQEAPLAVDRAVRIARQLCAALEAAESEGVVHRDLKPQNILLDEAENVYVSDFGLAKSLESDLGMTFTGQYLGTPRYMSPEQGEGKPVDHRSDIYSLGLILFEMVTGDMPFHADSALQLLRQRVQQKPPNPKALNPQIPEYLSRIILKCLETDPASRYQHAKEILNDLDAEAAPTTTVQITLPLLSRRAWLISCSATLAIMLTGLLIPRVRQFIFHGGRRSAAAALPSLASGKYIAVIPFRVLGDQATLNYAAIGLVEALSAKFFQLEDVHTSSVSAVQNLRQSDSLQEMAQQLGVNLLVSGTIQGSGEKLRIVVSLDDVVGGRRMWTQEFSGIPQDLLTLEDQIYGQLVDALALKPSPAEMARASGHPTENIQAYDLYLRGQSAMRGQLNEQNVQTAIGYYERAIKEDPTFALAYTGLADASLRMYRDKNDRLWADKALEVSQQAQRLNDTAPEVHFTLGSVYSATGKSAEAVSELRRALQLAPKSDDGYRRLGDAYRALGQKQEAIAAYVKATELGPYYWFNWNALGSAHFRFGENQKALESFRRVAELEPNNASAYVNLGAVYFQEGKWADCIPVFQKSLELEKRVLTYSNLGTVYFYLKRYDEAVTMFQKAVEMSPDSEFYMGNLADAYRWSGHAAEAKATYDKAIALAYKRLQVNPRDATTMEHLAEYSAKQGDLTTATMFIQRARAIDPSNVSLLYTQAVIYCLADKQQDAIEYVNQAIQKGLSPQIVKNDPELSKLQTRSEFAEMMNKYSKN
jgi:eukaryotic-like serine/threonine-protein kinase